MGKDTVSIDGDYFESMTYAASCPTCARYEGLNAAGVAVCGAFPIAIPLEIWRGEHDHKTSYNGDQGILYEPGQACGAGGKKRGCETA
jgi:hypothetical protein